MPAPQTLTTPILKLSHTQEESADSCLRKWWFQYDRRLPVIERGSRDFGTVGHGVLERWLKQDDLGRGEDPFAPGWEIPDGDASRALSPADQDLIRRLHRAAVEQGVLVRVPQRRVEWYFSQPMPGRPEIQSSGKVDLLAPGEITDHKFLKSLKYLPSPKNRSGWRQHYRYLIAAEADLRARNEVLPASWTFYVNGFSKDPEDFRVKRVPLPGVRSDEVREWHERERLPLVDEIAALAAAKLEETSWRDVPGPRQQGACTAFGGCPFVGICSQGETTTAHRTRVERFRQGAGVASATVEKRVQLGGAGTMGRFAEMMAAPTNPAPVAQPIAPAQVVTQEMIAAPIQQVRAPWADAACVACEGAGFNTKGNPCRICDQTAQAAGRPTSFEFTIATDGNGRATWAPKVDPNKVVRSVPIPAAPAPEAKPKVYEAPPSMPPKFAPAPEPVAVEEEDDEEAEAPAQPAAPAKRGRKKKGVTLYVNCYPTQGFEAPQNGSELLHRWGTLAAKELLKSDSAAMYQLDAFKRRDALGSVAGKIVEELGTATVVFRLDDPDTKALVQALRAVPGVRVVEGLQ